MRFRIRRLVLLCSGLALSVAAHAQQALIDSEVTGPLVHFTYSALLGTGVYQLDDRKVGVFRVTPSRELRPTTAERPGLRLLLPISVGLHNFDFDNLDALIDDENIATITVAPGLQFEYALRPNWLVKPTIYAGAGYDIDNDETAFLYGGAVGTIYDFGGDRPSTAFGGELLLAGHVPEEGQSKFITRLGLGLDMKFPTRWQLGEGTVFVNPQLIGYVYLNELEFDTLGRDDFGIYAEGQVGLAIGRDPPVKILGFDAERIGVAYRRGDGTEAWVLVYNFPF